MDGVQELMCLSFLILKEAHMCPSIKHSSVYEVGCLGSINDKQTNQQIVRKKQQNSACWETVKAVISPFKP